MAFLQEDRHQGVEASFLLYILYRIRSRPGCPLVDIYLYLYLAICVFRLGGSRVIISYWRCGVEGVKSKLFYSATVQLVTISREFIFLLDSPANITVHAVNLATYISKSRPIINTGCARLLA
jgi:hypothetical protein